MAQRQSNIELLRIVCMMMVLTVHFAGAAFGLPSPGELRNPSSGMAVKVAMESLAIVGVNCFVLISGYFGIRPTWKGLAAFSFWCLFASLSVFAAECAVRGFSAAKLIDAFCIYSATDLWFVPAYLGLYLLSPLINGGLRSLSGSRLSWLLVGLLFLNVYLGWFRGGKVNPYGYNEMQLILLYVAGHFLERNRHCFGQLRPGVYLGGYLLFSGAVFLSACFWDSRVAFAYNSPFVLASSVCFFLSFARMKPFFSGWVNRIAASAFMVYLLHKSPFLWSEIRKALYWFDAECSEWGFACCAVGLFAGVFAGSVLVDQVRLRLYGCLMKKLRLGKDA